MNDCGHRVCKIFNKIFRKNRDDHEEFERQREFELILSKSVMKIAFGRMFNSHNPQGNHILLLESEIDFLNIEVPFSREVFPERMSGILDLESAIKIRDYLNNWIKLIIKDDDNAANQRKSSKE